MIIKIQDMKTKDKKIGRRGDVRWEEMSIP
jgi:hypothetical protein